MDQNKGYKLEVKALKALAPYMVPESELESNLKGKEGIKEIAERHLGEKVKTIEEFNPDKPLDLYTLLDYLGVDLIVRKDNRLLAIDVTTCKSRYLNRKIEKMGRMKKFLDELGGFSPMILHVDSRDDVIGIEGSFFTDAFNCVVERKGVLYHSYGGYNGDI